MEFVSPDGQQRYAALARSAAGSVIGLDMDGTLAPIVEDPATALIHPDAHDVLVGLAARVRAIAVITGRPAQQALALGDLDTVGRAVGEQGAQLHVYGQYGIEHWSSTSRRISAPPPPEGLSGFVRALPELLRRVGAADAHVEEKGLAVAVHTRRMPDPTAALARLGEPVAELARSWGLAVEPGRSVIEVRPPGTDKGDAVRAIAEETGAEGFLFAGDDLGDVAAFEAVGELATRGVATLTVCSSSQEQGALRELADVVVPGPDGVLAMLRRLTADAHGPGDLHRAESGE